MKFTFTIFSIYLLSSLTSSKAAYSIPAFNSLSIQNQYIIQSSSQDTFSLLNQERIGELRINLSEERVKKIVSCSLEREPGGIQGFDGAYHQRWKYVNCGITLSMKSDTEGAPKSIESITLIAPSRLKTKRGIRIGSTKQAVMKAYKSEWSRESSNSDSFVAGSIYGGLIFTFENGKVSRIFLGAAAE